MRTIGFFWSILFVLVGIQIQGQDLRPFVIWSQKTHGYFFAPVAISPLGDLVASAGPSNSVRLAHLTDGSAVRHFQGHTAGVAAIAFSADSSMVASTADDRTLRIWDAELGSLLQTIPLGTGNRQFSAVAFHPDGKHVAADWNRNDLALYRVADGTRVWQTLGNSAGIQSITISPDGSLIAVSGGIRGLDITIRIINAQDGTLVRTLTTSNGYGVRQLAFSPDGQWLAAGCYESTSFPGAVEIWRVSDWSQHRKLPVTAPVLAFSPDGHFLITLRTDYMEFWSIPRGNLLARFGIPPAGSYSGHLSLAVSPNGQRLVVGNHKHINTPNGTLTESFLSALRFPVLATIRSGAGLPPTLSWTGGFSSFQIQRRDFGSSEWVNLGEATASQSVTLPMDGPGGMFRIQVREN